VEDLHAARRAYAGFATAYLARAGHGAAV